MQDISYDGSVVIASIDQGRYTSLRWTETEGLAILELPDGAEQSLVRALSADGRVIAGSTSSFFDPSLPEYFSAAIWDQSHGWRDIQQLLTNSGLDLTGWDLREAHSISADGRVIVGYGINPEGDTEAWMAVIPEPSTLLLCWPAVLIALCVLRQRRCAAAGCSQ